MKLTTRSFHFLCDRFARNLNQKCLLAHQLRGARRIASLNVKLNSRFFGIAKPSLFNFLFTEPSPRKQTPLQVLEECLKSKNMDLARITFITAEKSPDFFRDASRLTSKMIEICATCGDLAASEKYVSEAKIQKIRILPSAWAAMMKLYSSQRPPNVETIQSIFYSNSRANLPEFEDVYTKCMIEALLAKGDVVAAKKFIALLRRFSEADFTLWVSLLPKSAEDILKFFRLFESHLASADDDVVKIFFEYLARLKGTVSPEIWRSVVSSSLIYNLQLYAAHKTGDLDACKRLLKALRSRGFYPFPVVTKEIAWQFWKSSPNNVVQVIRETRDPVKFVLFLLQLICEEDLKGGIRLLGIFMDDTECARFLEPSFTFLFHQAIQRKDFSLFWELIPLLKRTRIELKPFLLHFMFEVAIQKEDLKEARALLKLMEDLSIVPLKLDYVHAFRLSCKSADHFVVCELFGKVLSQKTFTPALEDWHLLFRTLMNSNTHLDNIFDFFNTMKSRKIEMTAETYEIVIEVAVQCGLPERALEFIQEAKAKNLKLSEELFYERLPRYGHGIFPNSDDFC